jgi:hypothetical protein
MGQTSADAQREIEFVRDDLAATLGELERRARGLIELPSRASASPAARAGAGFIVAAGVVLLVQRFIAANRERQSRSQQLQRQARKLSSGLGDTFDQARAAFPYTIQRRDREESAMEMPRQQPSMGKSLLWMALTAGVVALFGLLARRVSAAVWQAVMHEAPPTRNI